ncbi:hypothetical protein [Nostoc sp.]|uniref:hypothetical protein n=1 Tax=Nostoc sp. TaxID=1180 RepID=UPI002FFB7D84
MSDEILEDIPQPDPAWDYYIQYHTLIKAKSQLERLIMFISKLETTTEHAQEILEQDLQGNYQHSRKYITA